MAAETRDDGGAGGIEKAGYAQRLGRFGGPEAQPGEGARHGNGWLRWRSVAVARAAGRG